MLIDIARSVGGYLYDAFAGNLDWGIMIGYVAQSSSLRISFAIIATMGLLIISLTRKINAPS